MIRLGARYNDRWQVVRPFVGGRSRNFVLFEVEDRATKYGDPPVHRRAVLKTVRKRDLPTEELLTWRRHLLSAEIDTAGELVHPALPEPLDVFRLDEDDEAVVYTQVGANPRDFLLRHILDRYGMRVHDDKARNLSRVARIMLGLLELTEELWELGFVHANLNPEHIYLLADEGFRLTGTSAICHVESGLVSPNEPQLRNVTIGYHGRRHHELLVRGDGEPLDAAKLRWHSYAALALELMWGRALSEYAAEHGRATVLLDQHVRRDIAADFPALDRLLRDERAATKRLRKAFDLIRSSLNDASALPADMTNQFRQAWRNLEDDLDVRDQLRVHVSELDRFAQIRDRGRNFRRGREDEALVLGHELHIPELEDTGRRAFYDACLSGGFQPDQAMGLVRTLPGYTVLLPGDVVPVVGKQVLDRDRVTILQPVDWVVAGRVTERDVGVRALSLGMFDRPALRNRPEPWASFELLGSVQAARIFGAHEEQRFQVFPVAGRFFHARVVERQGFVGLVPVAVPQVVPERSAWCEVRHVSHDLVFFEFPVDENHVATCVMGLDQVPRAVSEGDKIPVRIRNVSAERIWTEWDHAVGGTIATIGEVFEGELVRVQHHALIVRFGPGLTFVGHTPTTLVPWGLPVHHWAPGKPLRVRVEMRTYEERSNSFRYELDLEAPLPAVAARDVFVPGREYDAVVVDRKEDMGLFVHVLGPEGPERLEIPSLLHRAALPLGRNRDLDRCWPIGMNLRVRIWRADPKRRRVDLRYVPQ